MGIIHASQVIDDRKRPVAPPGKFRGIMLTIKHPYIEGENNDTLYKWVDVMDEKRNV
jgi:hypothetical protein